MKEDEHQGRDKKRTKMRLSTAAAELGGREHDAIFVLQSDRPTKRGLAGENEKKEAINSNCYIF